MNAIMVVCTHVAAVFVRTLQMQKVVDEEAKPARLGAFPDQDLIDVNLGDESGYTPLYVAATAGFVRAGIAVEFMLFITGFPSECACACELCRCQS